MTDECMGVDRGASIRRFVPAGVAGATVAALLMFWTLDVLTRRLATIPSADLDTPLLIVAAAAAHPGVFGLFIIVLAGLAWRFSRRLLMRWSELEHGRRLQAAASLVMATVVWRLTTSPRNFLYDEWYTADRVLLVMFLIAATLRPAAMVLVVIETRLLQAPLRAPPFPEPGLNIDELAVQFLIILVAVTMLVIVTNKRETSAALPITTAVVAAQFFLPGRTKIRARWFDNELSNLPLSGYHQGWLGSGDGSFARSLSDAISEIEPLLVFVTLVFEVGAIAIVFRRSLLVSWLLAAFGFHLAVLLTLGFVFFEFVIVEAAILLLVWGAAGREWSRRAFALGPALIAAFAVLLGPWIFPAPALAWFDTPLTYTYEIDGIDASGDRWSLVAGDFAPYDDVVAFGSLGLGPTTPVVGAYGAASRIARPLVDGYVSLDDIARDEEALKGNVREERIELLRRFLLSTHSGQGDGGWLVAPPQHFQISRPGRAYDFEVPLEQLVVERVTTLRGDDGDLVRREPVATIEMQAGDAVVRWS